MKIKSKALLLTLCAVLLVTASVLGTMAFLTDTEDVTNTFTVGSVGLALDEKDVDEDDNTTDNVTVNGVVRDKANSYKLMPGGTYIKDPTIRVDAGSEDCYLFVKVVDEIANIEDDTTVADQMAAKKWISVNGVANVYVYSTDGTNPTAVVAETTVPVFENFKIKDSVTNTELADYDGETITVTAYAVQKDGFEGKSAAEIWTTAFGAQNP